MDNTVLFYRDYKEIQDREKELVWLGAKWGLFLTIGFALSVFFLELLSGTTWQEWVKQLWNRHAYEGFIGNTKSKKYHKPNCANALIISESRRKYLKNRNEARKLGYQRCHDCLE